MYYALNPDFIAMNPSQANLVFGFELADCFSNATVNQWTCEGTGNGDIHRLQDVFEKNF